MPPSPTPAQHPRTPTNPMAQASHVIKHDLDVATAKKATEKAFAGYKERFADYNPTADWVADNRAEIGFSAKGVKLDGAVEIHPGEIHLELDVPLLFRPFRKKALAIIEEQIQLWVGKAKNGELD